MKTTSNLGSLEFYSALVLLVVPPSKLGLRFVKKKIHKIGISLICVWGRHKTLMNNSSKCDGCQKLTTKLILGLIAGGHISLLGKQVAASFVHREVMFYSHLM